MSVIWSGVTEEGAVVPVQVDETGKVIATAAVAGDYVKRTGDNMTGNLTFDENITLSVDGSAVFGGVVTSGDATGSNFDGTVGVRTGPTGFIDLFKSNDSNFITCNKGNSPVVVIGASGSAAFAGSVTAGDYPNPAVYISASSIYASANPRTATNGNSGVAVYQDGSNNGTIVIRNTAGNGNIVLSGSNGSASFASGKCGFTADGEIFFTSRNARYKLLVQGELVVAEPYTREMELKEKAEQFIADKRETKPSDPSDSQGGVSMDIDNSSPKQD